MKKLSIFLAVSMLVSCFSFAHYASAEDAELTVGARLLAEDNFDQYNNTTNLFKDKDKVNSYFGDANSKSYHQPGKWNYGQGFIGVDNPIVAASDASHGNVLELPSATNNGLVRDFEAQKNEMLCWELDFNVSNIYRVDTTPKKNNNAFMICIASSNGYTEILKVQDKKICYFYDNGKLDESSTVRVSNDVWGQWLHAKIELDQKNTSYSFVITDENGNEVLRKADVYLEKPAIFEEICGIRFHGQAQFTQIDNLKVRVIETSEIKLADRIASQNQSYDFESGSVEMGNVYGAADSAKVVTENGNNVLQLKQSETSPSTSSVEVGKDFVFKEGRKYQIKFDIKPGDGIMSALCFSGAKTDTDGKKTSYWPVNFEARAATNGVLYAGFNGNPGGVSTDGVELTNNKWYTATVTLDLTDGKKEVKTVVDNEKFLAAGDTEYHHVSDTRSIDNVPTGYKITLWWINTTQNATYIDDFEIKPIVEAPAVEAVSFITANGETAFDSTNAPDDATGIKVKFNTEIFSDTISDRSIAVYDSSAAKLNAAVTAGADNTAVLTFAEGAALMAGNSYTLYIAGTLTGVDGRQLEASKQMKFTAVQGAFSVRLNSVTYDENTVMTSLASAAGKAAKINLNVVNGNDKAVYTYIAYYDSQKKLVKTESYVQSAGTGTAAKSVDFTVMSSADMTAKDVQNMKVFVWTEEYKPLCGNGNIQL